ncbi:GNAT family N-acetyltransferase [Leptolyngbya sp. FACHB-261]|uniref:GNAT family N-acetyltransferase n=1 Tax=Leptolyngbya sp. FACHB-261 TaxID=2692806 RepID=UPI0016846F66|nr:GNAT family N-acetyltransferase [Leptolyngbya sp. FACHB-261]MBD2100757.1 GNAT family N-acetyltransferase [Leptolyngbya sp. FACHB-261]
MESSIRVGTENDAEDLSSVAAHTFALACPANTPQADLESYIESEFSPERFRDLFKDPKSIFQVAETSEKVAGYCMLYCSEVASEILLANAIEVKRFYVLPEFHGTGIAQKLMRSAIQLALENKYQQLWLSTSRENQRAISFYQKSGFVKVDEQTFQVGNDIQDDNIMALTLTH